MLAAVLAGGSSGRFGRDKFLYEICGKPMILHVIERLHQARSIDDVYVIASPVRVNALRKIGIENIIEDNLLIGPIGGILIALEQLGDTFIVAGDMPLLNPLFIDYIASIYLKEKSNYLAYVPAWSNGQLEPLHGIYAQPIIDLIMENIKEKKYSLHGLLRRLSNKLYTLPLDNLPVEYRISVYNVNTVNDLKRIKHKIN